MRRSTPVLTLLLILGLSSCCNQDNPQQTKEAVRSQRAPTDPCDPRPAAESFSRSLEHAQASMAETTARLNAQALGEAVELPATKKVEKPKRSFISSIFGNTCTNCPQCQAHKPSADILPVTPETGDPVYTPPVDSTPATTTPPTGSQAPPEFVNYAGLYIPTNNAQIDPDIVRAVLANGLTTPDIRNRGAVFGDNYPGTSAELHECVNDAFKNVTGLVKYFGFKTSELRLILNEQCTAANFKRFTEWVVTNDTEDDEEAIFNSSHGAQDQINGKLESVFVTYDMISTNRWDNNTEIPLSYWHSSLQKSKANYFFFTDSCHAGGAVKIFGNPNRPTRLARTIDGPDYVVARAEAATELSTARARLAELPGTFFASCTENQLSEEGPETGGAATFAFWTAVKKWREDPANAKKSSRDLAREVNKIMKDNAFSQTSLTTGGGAIRAPFQKKR